MGQSGKSRNGVPLLKKTRLPTAQAVELALFPSDLGWCGLWGAGGKVAALSIGHASPDEVRRRGERQFGVDDGIHAGGEADWHPDLRRNLQQYTSGRRVDFLDLELLLPPLTPFQASVIEQTRKTGYGRTVTYGRLAELAGFPGAARAVGSVMANNRIPIIIPCHRVVASGGRLGGFSAPQGVSLKRQMLDMEAGGIGIGS